MVILDIGKRIKYLRKFRKLTQVQFGKLLGFRTGMSPRVAQYEAMKRMPRSEMRNKISEVLGVNPKMLENVDEDEKTEILKCQTAHCGRYIPHFDFSAKPSPIVPYRHLPQSLSGMTADCRSLV